MHRPPTNFAFEVGIDTSSMALSVYMTKNTDGRRQRASQTRYQIVHERRAASASWLCCPETDMWVSTQWHFDSRCKEPKGKKWARPNCILVFSAAFLRYMRPVPDATGSKKEAIERNALPSFSLRMRSTGCPGEPDQVCRGASKPRPQGRGHRTR